MNLKEARHIYMVGIKGVGMTALALILQKMGKRVWGSDVDTEFQTDAVLKKHQMDIKSGFSSQNISEDIDIVITTAAHGGLTNPEVVEAKSRNITVLTHAEALGQLMDQFTHKIAVCGTHGKTTTSAMIAFIFTKMELSSGYHVGAATFSGLDSGDFTGLDYFVTEADEYVASPGADNTPRFMYLNPDMVVCTSIEYDHPDVYESVEKMEQAYKDFFKKLEGKKGKLIYNKQDEKLCQIVSQFSGIELHPYSQTDFPDLKLQIAGIHNRLNAIAALTVIKLLGLDPTKASEILGQFSNPSRRLQKIFEKNGTYLYDDYAHHPTAIRATIQALRESYPDKRIIVIFQPHTFSRTEALKEGFILSLRGANCAILTDIFSSARENSAAFTITSEKIVDQAKTQGITSIEYTPLSEIATKLQQIVTSGDIVVTMGAGSIYMLHSGIIDVIKHVT